MCFKGGLTLPLDAVRLALDLEARGCHLSADGDALLVGPRDRLTDQDRAQIRLWKFHILALLAYDADSAARTQ